MAKGKTVSVNQVLAVVQPTPVMFSRDNHELPARSAPKVGATYRHPSAGRAAVTGKRKA
jgi:hypothetical protein